MKQNRLLLLPVLTFLFVPAAFAVDFETFPAVREVLPGDMVDTLEERREEGMNRFFTDEDSLSYIPNCSLSDTIFQAVQDSDYKIAVETLYLIPREELAPSLRQKERPAYMRSLYNTLRSISTLEGIDYYSASRERMRLLFAESWAISGPEDHSKIDDPLVQKIPSQDTVYIHQKDLTFGTNRYRVEYLHEEGAISMEIVNLNTMTYKIFPLVGEGNMSMRLLVVPVKEGIIFYGLNTVDMLDLKIFHKKMEDSFTNRMIALYNWYARQIGPGGNND